MALLFGTVALAQMSISGKVIDPTGLTIPTGVVIFTMPDGITRRPHSVTSERDGKFEVTGLDAGVYTVVVTCEGFQSASFNIQLFEAHPRVDLGLVVLRIGRVTMY